MGPLTHREMLAMDINAEYLGIPREVLMENAGREVSQVLRERLDIGGKRVAVVCGTGNNGGDGFVAARHLAGGGAEVKVVLVGREDSIKTAEARKMYAALKGKGVEILSPNELKSALDWAEVAVDALLGTGMAGPLREPHRTAVALMNASRAYKVSVDVPSGLDEKGGGECVRADLVVALHRAKKGLERFETTVKEIGIPKEAELYMGPGDLVVNLWKRTAESHKGDHGRVLVLGGSDLYHGAPILSASGALYSGADIVYLMVPDANYDVSRTYLPDLIVRKYPGAWFNEAGVKPVLELAENCDAVVMGPGLGPRDESAEAVLELMARLERPVVIDAEALKALKGRQDLLGRSEAVLTPHPGEFLALTGEELPGDLEGRKRAVARWAGVYKAAILLKSPVDVIAAPDGRVRLNATGNPGMTVGGTGDVLAGLVGGFMAQGLGPFEAAGCGAFLNGAAGDELYKRKGYGFTASDLAVELPHTLKGLLDSFGTDQEPKEG